MKKREAKQTAVDVPRGPFPYADYEAARTALRSAMESGHFFASIDGPSGTGKSSLARQLASEVPSSRVQIVYVSSTSASAFGLVNTLARALRVRVKRSSLETSQRCVAALRRAAPLRYLVWLDEADQVSPAVLGELRVLAESDLASQQIMSVVLSGLPDLRVLLDAPELFPLKRRLAFRCQLAGLRRDELDAFLVHHFGSGVLDRLSEELRDELFERTEAAPALVHKVVTFVTRKDGPVNDSLLQQAFNACL